MKNYQNVAYGLKLVFLTELMQTLCEFLPPIVFLAGWIFASDGFIDSLYFLYFGRILFSALCGLSLYSMGKEISTCKKAAALCFVDVAALVIRVIVHAERIGDASYIMYFGAEEGMNVYDEYLEGAAAWIDLIAGIGHCVAPLLAVYFVCKSVSAVMKELGADEIAKFGQVVWVTNLVMSILFMIVSFLPELIRTDGSRLALFVAAVLYLRFLHASYRALDAQDRDEE